jgi:predicted nucleic acid-binding protein
MRAQIVSDADVRLIPPNATLAGKDQPILAAAIAGSVEYLATGDKSHFAHLYNKSVLGVRILTPRDFLDLHEDRLIR